MKSCQHAGRKMDLYPLKTQIRKRNIEHIYTPEHTNMTQLIWKHSKSKQKEMQHLKTTDPITLYIHKHTRLAPPLPFLQPTI